MKSFEWFLKLLANFEKEQESWEHTATTSMENTIEGRHRFLDIHLYFTDIKQDSNIGSVPLDLVTRVYEQAYQEDVFTHLKTKTHIGRPNWDELLGAIVAKDSQRDKKDVCVFFCGPKSMTQPIKVACTKHKIKFHKEQF
jgi:predicted ferric reductase